jgi:hypothetical protein
MNETEQLNCSLDTENVQSWLYFTDRILVVYPWIILIVGSFTNVLSFCVLTRPKLRVSSTFFYLSALSIIDLLIIYTFSINFIATYQIGIDLQHESEFICRLYSFLIYFLPQFSAWTCVAVSLDRVVSVVFRSRGKYINAAKRWNNPRWARYIMSFTFTILFTLNAQ